MLTFIIYELKVARTLITFPPPLQVLLSQEKMHRVNRIVIPATSVLSFILPLCVITVHKTVYIPEVTVFGISGDAVELHSYHRKPWRSILGNHIYHSNTLDRELPRPAAE